MSGSILKVINSISSITYFLLAILALLVADEIAAYGQEDCEEAKCGIFEPPIRFPFRLRNKQPRHCGYPGFDLSCTEANETALDLSGYENIGKSFFVRAIVYGDRSMFLDNFDLNDSCHSNKPSFEIFNLSISPFNFPPDFITKTTIFNCSANCTDLEIFSTLPCVSDNRSLIVAVNSSLDVSIFYHSLVNCNCTRILNRSFVPLEMLSRGYPSKLIWSEPDCRKCEVKGQRCRLSDEAKIECFGGHSSREDSIIIIGVAVGFSVLMIAAGGVFLYVYDLDGNESENQQSIRKFLEDYYNFKPSRYAFVDIKRITNNFKVKLGQGAYGTVYKGKVSKDILVAVKILNNSNGKGEEFINEVATMGQIHHVNVVRLVGYCAEGFRRALIYEFLPNNSLDKYIALGTGRSKPLLSWETLCDIALGIAKGVEYLHQGCDQRILHFDIKPHNILLDRNFLPKISDFGLAKLCSKDQSSVSMNTARGTMGYIAPEVFSRNFGNVSYKSDVYSFGMVLLEMVGGRKNTNETRENIDDVYYPEWIYNLLEEGEDLRILINEEENANIAKKLAIVGLWCIQWHPISRPTMKGVVKMLEGGLEELTMPPNPFASVLSSSRANTKMIERKKAQDLEAIAE